MKHGMTAKLPVALPGEDPEVFKARFAAFKGDLKPQSFVEEYLAERAAFISLQIERCDRAIDSKLNDRVRYAEFDAEEAETDLVEDLTRRLFWDPRGPIALYPHFRGFRHLPRISSPETVEDPLNPARIVNRLEHLALGCRWLIDRWTGLRQLLEDGLKWQAPDRLRAIRLLGRQPMDALADDRVLMIYLACDAMDPTAPTSFDDLLTETDDNELKLFKERVKGRGGDWRKPASPVAGKAALLALIEQVIRPLSLKLSVLRERQEFQKSIRCDLRAFDDSPKGELARRYQLAKGREFYRTISTYFKVQHEVAAAAEADSTDAVCLDREAEAPVAGAASLGPEWMAAAGSEPPAWVQPADPSPGEPDVMSAGSVQSNGASVDESEGCVEPSSARPAREGPIAGDETNPNPAADAGDRTNPNPAADAGDKTNPNPPAPTPLAGVPSLEEYALAVVARLERYGPLSPSVREAARELQSHGMS